MVPARPFVLHLVGDVAQRLLDLIGRAGPHLQAASDCRDQRLNLPPFRPDLTRSTGAAFAS